MERLVYENGNRKAVIKDGVAFCKGKFTISFYRNDDPDYEWKRGASDMYTDICDTLASAKAKAKRYINK